MSYRILITGSLGFLGANIVEYMLIKGYSVIGVDNALYKNRHIADKLARMYGKNRYQHHHLDVTNPIDQLAIGKLIQDCDIFLPLACIVGEPATSKHPELAQKTTVDALINQLTYCTDQMVIYPHTNSGATNGLNGISDETCPVVARSLYSIQKEMAAKAVSEYPNHIILKLATVFGMGFRTRLDLLVNCIAYEGYFNKRVELFEGEFKRNYIGTPDISRLFSHCIDRFQMMKNETYNAGSDILNCSKRQLCEKIAQYIPFETYQSNKTDVDARNYIISSAKLAKTGFKPHYSLDEGIQDLIKWFETLPKNKEERENWIKYNRNTSI